MDNVLDKTVDMLVTLLCAGSDQDDLMELSSYNGKSGPHQVDAGATLGIGNMMPSMSYTSFVGDREFAIDSGLLLESPQDLLGLKSEVSMFADDYLNWVGIEKLNRRPRNLWVASANCDLYALHHRKIGPQGIDSYGVRVGAINKHGKPVQTVIQGTKETGGSSAGSQLVLAASVIEDNYRPNTFLAKVSDSVGVAFAVPNGEHLSLFKLRDGPYSGSKRRPLMHWVASHIRRTATKETDVKEHLRGITEFEIDGLRVCLDANKRIK